MYEIPEKLVTYIVKTTYNNHLRGIHKWRYANSLLNDPLSQTLGQNWRHSVAFISWSFFIFLGCEYDRGKAFSQPELHPAVKTAFSDFGEKNSSWVFLSCMCCLLLVPMVIEWLYNTPTTLLLHWVQLSSLTSGAGMAVIQVYPENMIFHY